MGGGCFVGGGVLFGEGEFAFGEVGGADAVEDVEEVAEFAGFGVGLQGGFQGPDAQELLGGAIEFRVGDLGGADEFGFIAGLANAVLRVPPMLETAE